MSLFFQLLTVPRFLSPVRLHDNKKMFVESCCSCGLCFICSVVVVVVSHTVQLEMMMMFFLFILLFGQKTVVREK